MNSPIDLVPADSAVIVAVVVLLALLIARELAAVAGPRFRPLARNLMVVIVPLLIVFVLIGANRILLLLVAPTTTDAPAEVGQPPGADATPPVTPATPAPPAPPAADAAQPAQAAVAPPADEAAELGQAHSAPHPDDAAAGLAQAPAAPHAGEAADPGQTQSTPPADRSADPGPALVPAPPADEPAAPARTAPDARPVAPAVSPVLVDESFAQPRPGWPDDPRGTAWFADGAYQLAVRQAQRFVAVGVPLPDLLRDVRVRAGFRKQGGPPGGGYGVLLRDQGPGPRDGWNQGGRYYVLAVGDLGQVGIWRREQDHWVDLVPWQPAAAVRPGQQANDVEASAAGGQLRLVVNGQAVATATDGLASAGAVGIFVGGDFNQVTLEHLEVDLPR